MIGAGKTSKAGAISKKPATTTNPPKLKQPVVKKTSSVKDPITPVEPDEKYASSGYMEISGISFANIDNNGHIIDDYGSNLYAGDVKYLKPRLFYRGLASDEKNISVDIKIIKEDGTLESGTKSPEGYTYSSSFDVISGTGNSIDLSGWGRNIAGSYIAGQYKFEVWYKGNILFQKGFRLYSGTTPLASSKILKIKSVSFGNQTKDGKMISSYGDPLYAGEVKYLAPKMYYEGLYSTNQTITLFYRIFKPDGNLSSGSSSPLGFSSKQTITIKPGSNFIELNGWGNDDGTVYSEGTAKIEYWLDGEKIYETSVTISKKNTPSISALNTSSTINDFFPLWGITLGKTTWKQAEDAGYKVKLHDGGPSRSVDVNGADFWDHGGSGMFTSLYWTKYDADFPDFWKTKGFSWDSSYNDWLIVFRKLGFKINVTKEPTTKEYSGRNTLSAAFIAIPPDSSFEFELKFDYGENGYSTSSSKTLYSVRARIKDN